MSYKDDLRAINAALRNPKSKCYDPLLHKPPISTHARREKNRRKLRQRERAVIWKQEHPEKVREYAMNWRKKHADKYRAYMREYMRKRAARAAGGVGEGLMAAV